MTVDSARPAHPESAGSQKAEELLVSLRDLPIETQDAVWGELAEVVTTYTDTGRVDPLIHFVKSLDMTTRLHRNPAYRKSLAEADEAAGRPPQDEVVVTGLLARLRAGG